MVSHRSPKNPLLLGCGGNSKVHWPVVFDDDGADPIGEVCCAGVSVSAGDTGQCRCSGGGQGYYAFSQFTVRGTVEIMRQIGIGIEINNSAFPDILVRIDTVIAEMNIEDSGLLANDDEGMRGDASAQ